MSNCTGCGGCCSSLLPVSKTEIKDIRKYIKKHNIKPVKALGMLDCPFCDITKSKDKCLIYPVRPWICQVFNCHGITAEKRAVRKARMVVNMQEVFGRADND